MNHNDFYKNDAENRNNHTLDIPILFENKLNCCGCSACFNVCPTHAINMEPDEEGFLYPVIEIDKCVRCHMCISVCAFKIDQESRGFL